MKQIEKGEEDLRGIPFLFYLVFCSNACFAPNPAYRQCQRGGGGEQYIRQNGFFTGLHVVRFPGGGGPLRVGSGRGPLGGNGGRCRGSGGRAPLRFAGGRFADRPEKSGGGNVAVSVQRIIVRIVRVIGRNAAHADPVLCPDVPQRIYRPCLEDDAAVTARLD